MSGAEQVTNTSNFLLALTASLNACRTTLDFEWIRTFCNTIIYYYSFHEIYCMNNLQDLTEPSAMKAEASLAIFPLAPSNFFKNICPRLNIAFLQYWKSLLSILARVMNLKNNSQPDATAVTGYLVCFIVVMACWKLNRSSWIVPAKKKYRALF